MAVKFHKVVEEVNALNLEDKLYLKDLVDKIIIDEKREKIKRHADDSLKEYEEGKIKFGTIKDLRKEIYGS